MNRESRQPVGERDAGPPGAAGEGAAAEQFAMERDDLYARIIAAQNEIASLAHDPNRVIEAVIGRAQELTRSTGAAVEIVDGDDIVYWAASGSASGQVGLRLRLIESLSGRCITENRVLRCDDAEHDERVNLEACRRVGLRSMLVTPLLHEGRPFGVLKVLSPFPFAYRERDVRSMAMMATLVGAVLGHAIQYSDLLDEYNHRVEADRSEARLRADSVDAVRALIRDHGIDMVFQPIVALDTRRVFAFEALARFPDKALAPDAWFARAAGVGLGLELELEAAALALDRLDALPHPYRLSINASPETIVSPAFDALLARHDSARLMIEITEHTTVDDYARLRERLAALRAKGMLIAIDDAGAGFASLRHILHLDPDVIKLDISLTRGIDGDTRRQTMVSAIRAFAAGTNATIVVEGVETEGELRTLLDLGIEYAQGYHLARPARWCDVARSLGVDTD
jgi:EAL domain-containing protein (putative c-di-GMP-specific phosphodiesterase class I)